MSGTKKPSAPPATNQVNFLVREFDLVQDVTTDDVWRWLAAGWADLKANMAVSMGYTAVFIVLGLVISFGFYFMGWPYLILPGLSGFLLVGPAVGIGYYEISRRSAAGQSASALSAVTACGRNKLGIFGLGIALVFLLQVWIRLSFTIFALNFPGIMPEWGEILVRAISLEGIYFGISIVVAGAVFAALVFFVAAFAMPMMMGRRTLLVPAMITSCYAVVRNKRAMALWAAIIVVLTGFGLITGFIGLLVTMPLLGHATWHAYNQVIAGELPEGDCVPAGA